MENNVLVSIENVKGGRFTFNFREEYEVIWNGIHRIIFIPMGAFYDRIIKFALESNWINFDDFENKEYGVCFSFNWENETLKVELRNDDCELDVVFSKTFHATVKWGY